MNIISISSRRHGPCLPAALALLAWADSGHALTTLTLGESSGAAGGSRSVPLHFESTDAVAAIQLDIDHAGGTLGDPLPGTAAEGHLFDSERVQGKLRAVVCTGDNSPLASGTLMEIPVNFTTNVPETQRSLSLGNVILSDPDGGSVQAFLMPFGRISQPASGTVFADSFIEGLKIDAVALDTDKGVSSVEFKVDGQSIGLSTTAPFSLRWHPTAEGSYVITALVTDDDGNQIELAPKPVSVGLLTGYESWAVAYFGEDAGDPLIAGRQADPNRNGLPNIFEFALGRNPLVHTAAGLPLPEIKTLGESDYLTISFRLPVSVDGVSYRVEVSDNLKTWRSGEGHTVELPPQVDGLIKTVTVRSARPVDASGPGEFMRLTVDLE